MNTYIDCIAYSRAQPHGLVLAPFIGNMARMSAAAQGATTLTVPALTVAQVEYDNIFIFDGPSSEVVLVGPAGAGVNATSIPLLNGTQYAHAAGTSYCSDGTMGSLGEQIFTASKQIEDEICYQALWATSYTNEILTMPTMRAAIDNEANIHFRPRHFPISSFTSITLQDVRKNQTPLDPTQTTVDSDQQTVDISLSALLGSQSQQSQGSPYPYSTIERGTTAWLILAYTAGFAIGQLPRPISRACALLTNECFRLLENPIGADSIRQSDRQVTFVLRGDLSGESGLVKDAKRLLQPYVTESF